MQAHADILRCFTLVETGELIGGSSYYERFDGNPQRAEIEFNLKERYLVNHLGKWFSLEKASDDIYVMEEDRRYAYIVKDTGNLVLEVRVDKDAATIKIFECKWFCGS